MAGAALRYALSCSDVEQLLTRDDVSLRERMFSRMAYETAARSAEVRGPRSAQPPGQGPP